MPTIPGIGYGDLRYFGNTILNTTCMDRISLEETVIADNYNHAGFVTAMDKPNSDFDRYPGFVSRLKPQSEKWFENAFKQNN